MITLLGKLGRRLRGEQQHVGQGHEERPVVALDEGDVAVAKREIIIAGHSHSLVFTYHMRAPSGDPQAEGESRALWPIGDFGHVFGLHGGARDERGYFEAIAQFAEDRCVALLWQGNQHAASFLLEHETPFDFIPRGLESLPLQEGAVIIPEAMVRARFRDKLVELSETLELILNQQNASVALIGTPPPKRGEIVRELASNEAFFAQQMRHRNLTSSSVMLKLWFVLQQVYEEFAKERGLLFVPVSPTVRDEAGFLKQEFWAGDATHANGDYALEMLPHVIQAIHSHPAGSMSR